MNNRILYHASMIEIPEPLANIGRKDLDFGPGFYLTNDRQQAENWAHTVSSRKKKGNPIVNIYEFDEESFLIESYNKKIFDSYSIEWLDFVSASRKGSQPWKGYDWIEGGIANDSVISTVDAYVDGFINAHQALDKLENEKLRHQVCISNQDIINRCLKFVKADTL